MEVTSLRSCLDLGPSTVSRRHQTTKTRLAKPGRAQPAWPAATSNYALEQVSYRIEQAVTGYDRLQAGRARAVHV